MANKCGKCCDDLLSGDINVVCSDCKSQFHPACAQFGSAQNLTKSKLKSWKCENCKGETASTTSSRSVEDAEDKKSILEAISLMRSDLSRQIGGVEASINTLSKELKGLSVKVHAVEEEQTKIKLRCDTLENTNKNMNNKIQQLQERLHSVEQYSRSANIEIQGLPLTTGEDIYSILGNIAKAIGVTYYRSDISMAHRLKLFSKNHAHPTIIAQFVLRSKKDIWMEAARVNRGISTSKIEPSLQPSLVYINDHLTSDNKAMLGRARRLCREKRLHFATYSNGKVLVRRKEGEDKIRITSMDQLDEFDK